MTKNMGNFQEAFTNLYKKYFSFDLNHMHALGVVDFKIC